jgi:tetratricopeptide (TPR) repeat protein
VWDKALTYLGKMGHQAAARSANREAVACFEQALEALSHLPDERRHREQAVDLRFALRSALHPLGQFTAALQHLRTAEGLAEELGDQRRHGRALAYMANHFWWMGDHRRAVESGQRALGLARAVGDLPLQVLTNFFLGQAYNSMGDYRAAVEFTGQNVTALHGELAYERFGLTGLRSVLSRSHAARALAELGEFARAATQAESAVQIAETVAHPYDVIVAYIAANDVWLRKGDVDRAIPFMERALTLHQTANLPVWFPTIATNLGLAYALAGRVDEAVPLLERAVDQAVRMKTMFNHALRLTWLGEAYLIADRADDAAQAAARALALAREQRERGHEAWALRLLGAIDAARPTPAVDACEARFREALDLAEQLGLRPLRARGLLDQGILQRRAGHAEQARTYLQTAVAELRQLDMGLWLSRAETELAGLGAP